MFSSIVWPSWGEIFHGEVSFGRFGEIISAMFSELVEHEYFAELYNGIASAVQSLIIPILAVFAVLSIVLSMRGRKLLTIVRFVAFFIVGFLFGTSFIAPLVFGSSASVLPWILGAIIGVALMLLSKYLYRALYVVFFGYSAYMIFMGGQLLPESIVGFTKDNMVIALVATCVTIVLTVLLRKPVEIIGTAILGGYLFSLCVDGILLNAFSVERIAALSIVLMIFIALFGTAKQFGLKKSKKAKKVKKK